MSRRPPWLVRGMRVWFFQTDRVLGEVDSRGAVLESRRRGFRPSRRQLTPDELAAALESGALRPFNTQTKEEDMSRMSDAYGSRFFKGADLGGKQHLFTIERAAFEPLQDFNDAKKYNDRLVLSFVETGKDYAVNATSAKVLMTGYGEDESQYVGKKVVLYSLSMNVAGLVRDVVMIRLPRQHAPTTPAAPTPTMPPVDATTAGDFDDDIPF